MRMERHGHTLQTTAPVNEAYLKLVRINGGLFGLGRLDEALCGTIA
jgi:hypothetical protein